MQNANFNDSKPKKRLRLPEFLNQYDMARTTFDELRHRYKDPIPCYKIGRAIYVNMEEYPAWEKREAARNA